MILSKFDKLQFLCPLCEVMFHSDEVIDENGSEIPEIYGFGPTGQVSHLHRSAEFEVIYFTFQPSEIEIVEVLQNLSCDYILDRMVALTACVLPIFLSYSISSGAFFSALFCSKFQNSLKTLEE